MMGCGCGEIERGLGDIHSVLLLCRMRGGRGLDLRPRLHGQ
jgi:hypothetical protein